LEKILGVAAALPFLGIFNWVSFGLLIATRHFQPGLIFFQVFSAVIDLGLLAAAINWLRRRWDG